MITQEVKAFISERNHDLLKSLANDKDVPVYRLVALAIDNELMKEKPFDIDLSVPDVDWEDYAYSDYASKILSFINRYGNQIDLPMLYLLRHEVGIEDRQTLLCAFAELLKFDFIEPFKYRARFSKVERISYRIKGKLEGAKKKRYNTFLKLKKEFDGMKED